MKRETTEKEIIRLLEECGMVSRDENYTHQHIREMVAYFIHKMEPPCAKQSLLNTLRFLLYKDAGE